MNAGNFTPFKTVKVLRSFDFGVSIIRTYGSLSPVKTTPCSVNSSLSLGNSLFLVSGTDALAVTIDRPASSLPERHIGNAHLCFVGAGPTCFDTYILRIGCIGKP